VAKLKLLILLLLLGSPSIAQLVDGEVLNWQGQPIEGVTIIAGKSGTISDEQGKWSLNLPPDVTHIIIEHIAYKPAEIRVIPGQSFYQLKLEKSDLALEEVVVSGSRKSVPKHNAPLIVNTINPKLFENIAALSLAEGLNFSPGLRLENNCQNCGFTQVRINGLEGAYSQVLLNSRPIFSSLMGVYGLEMFPPTMIDRVEVLKGGGSAMYGGNAIGGTINIITKEALKNSYFLQSQIDLIGGEAIQHHQSLGASLVNEEANAGINLFAFNRSREAWDANDDGFSEITKLQSQSIGFNSYYKSHAREKWTWDLFYIREFRRGGSDFELKPHQSRIAEQLKHNILGTGLSYEKLSADNSRQWSAYLSAQRTWRNSYYGGGGRVLSPGDSLTSADLLALNAYGESEDLTLVGGFVIHQKIGERWNFSLGSEYQANDLSDIMTGYQRKIEQTVQTWGTYLQSEYQLNDQWLMQAGARLDANHINNSNILGGLSYYDKATYLNLSPRFSLKYALDRNLKFRGSYARGFRAPQAFNEDLHIAVVGGSALFIQLDPELDLEKSNSYNLSVDWNLQRPFYEANFIANAFYTELKNNFILSDQQELPNGSARLLKRNGEGARVYGLNLEYSHYWSAWTLQSSFTLQRSLFSEDEVLWSSGDSIVSTREMLRAPNIYGYLSASYKLNDHWDLKSSLNFTGPMLLSHIIDPNTEYPQLKRSPNFFDVSLSAETLIWHNPAGWALKAHAGVRNVLNAYQKDFDRGEDRDAGYIYGPNQPRTYFLTLKLEMD